MSAANTTSLDNPKIRDCICLLQAAVEMHIEDMNEIDPKGMSFEELYKTKNKAHKELKASFNMVVQELINISEFAISERNNQNT